MMSAPIEVTRLTCPAVLMQTGAQPGDDNTTHHLVPRGPRTGRSMVCRYCGHTEADLRFAAENSPPCQNYSQAGRRR